jgi:hypothetical protein
MCSIESHSLRHQLLHLAVWPLPSLAGALGVVALAHGFVLKAPAFHLILVVLLGFIAYRRAQTARRRYDDVIDGRPTRPVRRWDVGFLLFSALVVALIASLWAAPEPYMVDFNVLWATVVMLDAAELTLRILAPKAAASSGVKWDNPCHAGHQLDVEGYRYHEVLIPGKTGPLPSGETAAIGAFQVFCDCGKFLALGRDAWLQKVKLAQ